jgi:hypothetical protein
MSKHPPHEVLSVIEEKTARLIAAKQAYNKLITSTNEEFSRKFAELDEEMIHIPLKTAKCCLKAITGDRSLLPEAIDLLKEQIHTHDLLCRGMQDGRDGSTNSEVLVSEDVRDAAGDDSSICEDNCVLNLTSISLDAVTYLQQFDAQDTLNVDAFED